MRCRREMWQKGEAKEVRWGEQREVRSGISMCEGKGGGDGTRE